jgi:carbamoyltransferase
LLQAFYRKTGCPMMINTSFNVRGEPIVCTPEQAVRCFQATDMDALVIENYVLEKRNSTETPRMNREEYLSQFQLD